MSDLKKTPDELAEMVRALLSEHGVGLRSLDFETVNGGNFGGRHSYSCVVSVDYVAGELVAAFERS